VVETRGGAEIFRVFGAAAVASRLVEVLFSSAMAATGH
jgi:hypothetical protein